MMTDAKMMLKAQQCVSERAGSPESDREKYKIWSRSTAGLVRNSGLALAVSFLISKSKEGTGNNGFTWLLEDVLQVMGKETATDGLAQKYDGMQPQEYMVETERFLRALAFIKRFAERLVDAKDDNAKGGELPSEEQSNASSGI